MIARGISVDAAAVLLGHTSTKITEGHYIEPDATVDFAPADVLERALRSNNPDRTLLGGTSDDEEELALDIIDDDADEVSA